MRHVDAETCSPPSGDHSTTQMMASMLDLTRSSYEWSNCSVIELNEFLRSGDADCLFNAPLATLPLDALGNVSEVAQRAKYPGRFAHTYSLRQQCQQIFGAASDVCDQTLVI